MSDFGSHSFPIIFKPLSVTHNPSPERTEKALKWIGQDTNRAELHSLVSILCATLRNSAVLCVTPGESRPSTVSHRPFPETKKSLTAL
jgi:hypothetical protein